MKVSEYYEKFRRHWMLLLVVCLAALVRLPGLADKGLWLDEAYSVHLARLPMGSFLSALSQDCTPPLYYLLLKGMMLVFGIDEWAVRLLSLFCSIGTVITVYLIGRRWFSHPAPLCAAIVAAFSPLQLYYAREARNYSLLILLTCLLVRSVLRIGEPASGKNRSAGVGSAYVVLALASVLLLYTHTVAVWIVAGAYLVLGIRRIVLRQSLAALAWSAGAVAAAYAPWLPFLADQVGQQQATLDWFVPFWRESNIAVHAWHTVAGFLFGPYPPYIALVHPAATATVFSSVFTLVALFGVMRGIRRWQIITLASVSAAALLFAIVYSAFVQPVYIPGRTDQFAYPLFALLLTAGICALRRPWAIAAAMVLYCIACIYIASADYADGNKNYSRAYMESMRWISRPGDIVITTGYTYALAEYYNFKWKMGLVLLPYPAEQAAHPGYFNPTAAGLSSGELQAEAEGIASRVGKTLAESRKAFVLITPYRLNDILMNALANRITVQQSDKTVYQESLINTPVGILECLPKRGNVAKPPSTEEFSTKKLFE